MPTVLAGLHYDVEYKLYCTVSHTEMYRVCVIN